MTADEDYSRRRLALTKRGVSAALSGAISASLGIAYWDPVLSAAGLGVGALLSSEVLSAFKLAKGAAQAEVRPRSVRLSTVAGEEVLFGLEIDVAGTGVEVDVDPPFAVVEQTPVDLETGSGPAQNGIRGTRASEDGGRRRGVRVRVALKPDLYGRYRLGRVVLRERSRLGAAEAVSALDLDAEVKAYPRFYPFALEALSLLGEGSPEGEGQASLSRVGRGMEYAWSRQYEPGDSPRTLDWKATARTSRLFVKEYLEERGGRGALVFFDGRAPGRRSADEVARDLLSAVLGILASGQEVVLVSNRGESHGVAAGAPEEVLRAALSEAFGMVLRVDTEVFSLFPPAVQSSLMRLLKRQGGSGGGVGGDGGIRKRDAYAEALRLMGERGLGLVYAGCPLYGTREVLAMLSEAASRGRLARVILPTKPWLDAGSLEDAYVIKKSWELITKRIPAVSGRLGALQAAYA